MDFERKYKARKVIEKFNIKSVIELLEKFGIENCLPMLMKNSVNGEDLLRLTRNIMRPWCIDEDETSKLLDLIADMKENPEHYVDEEEVVEDAEHVYEEFENTETQKHAVENPALSFQEQLKQAWQKRNARESNQNQNADDTFHKNNSRMQNISPQSPSIPRALKPKLSHPVSKSEAPRKSSNNITTKSASADSNKIPDKLPKIVSFVSTMNIANKPLPKLPSEENIDRIQDTKYAETPQSEDVIFNVVDDEVVTYENSEKYFSDSSFDGDDASYSHVFEDTEEPEPFYRNEIENYINGTDPQFPAQEGGTVKTILTKLEQPIKFVRNNSRTNNVQPDQIQHSPNRDDDLEEYVPMAGKVLKNVRKFSDAKSKFENEANRDIPKSNTSAPGPSSKIILDLSNAAYKPIPKLPSDGDLNGISDSTKFDRRVINPAMPNNPVVRSASMKAQSSRTQSRNQLPASPNNLSTDFEIELAQRLNRFAISSRNSERDSQAKASTSSSNSSAFDNPDYLVPVSGIDQVSIAQETYFKDISREQASRMLADKPNGTFIIRPSKNNEGYTLVVRYNKADFNIKIRQRGCDGKFAVGTYRDGEIAFTSIQSMIRYYSSGVEKLTLFTKSKIYGHTHLYPV